jgi:hypothetical protein
MTQEAIFLHSSWRAASTYVWSKFRQRPDTYCYFEPLNENLSTATAEIIDDYRPWSFANHPMLDAPYMSELLPLIVPGGGIPNFPAHLSYGQYCADRDTDLPELQAYLADLADLAAQHGRRPVYGFVRTDLRVGWFRARMPGAHIFIRREPRRQFLSLVHQARHGNPFFLQRGLVILLHNVETPAFAPLISTIDLPALVNSSGLRELFQGRVSDVTPLESLYTIFYFMWLLARQLGEAHCDLVIDIDRLCSDESYRGEVQSRLRDLVGMAISFTDCRVERHEMNLSWGNAHFDALERDVELNATMGRHAFLARQGQK